MTLDDKGEQLGWGEDNSAFFIATGKVFTPGREEMAEVFLDLVPAAPAEAFTAVDIGAGAGSTASLMSSLTFSTLTFGLLGENEPVGAHRKSTWLFSLSVQ